ncbi:MAG: DUF5367 domain-containing protein [Leptolyngbyaceae cyanobacterium SM2_5_2]|nr:DUF5367 domain-containing protein [Leptolyngbyaceae cyanobacterium SM2_5_2]
MTRQDNASVILVGFGIWAAATLVYQQVGAYFFEGSALTYWLNIVSTSGLCILAFVGLMRWRQIAPQDWLQGVACLALPGMLGEIPILANFGDLMSVMQPETAGRYGAFLFACYSALIGFAWLIATRAARKPLPAAESAL